MNFIVKVVRLGSDTFCEPQNAEKWTFESNFANFDEVEKQCKASDDAFNRGGLLILDERVAEGDASDPHDFTHGGECAL